MSVVVEVVASLKLVVVDIVEVESVVVGGNGVIWSEGGGGNQ